MRNRGVLVKLVLLVAIPVLAIGGMGVLYMAHSFEVYRYTKQGKYGPEEDTISFGINRLPTIGAGISTKNITFSPNPIHNTQFELKFSHSF